MTNDPKTIAALAADPTMIKHVKLRFADVDVWLTLGGADTTLLLSIANNNDVEYSAKTINYDDDVISQAVLIDFNFDDTSRRTA